jgi:Prokaryotic cytochrome b561
MPRAQQRFAKASEYCLYAPLLLQPLTGLAQLARGRSFMLFEWRVPKVMAGNEALTLLFHEIHTVSAWLLLGLIGLHVLAALFTALSLRTRCSNRCYPGGLQMLLRLRRALRSRPRMRHVLIRQAAKQRLLQRSLPSERSTPSSVSVFGSLHQNYSFDIEERAATTSLTRAESRQNPSYTNRFIDELLAR